MGSTGVRKCFAKGCTEGFLGFCTISGRIRSCYDQSIKYTEALLPLTSERASKLEFTGGAQDAGAG